MSINDAALLTPVILVLSLLMATPIFFHTKLSLPFAEIIVNDTADHTSGGSEQEPETEAAAGTGSDDNGGGGGFEVKDWSHLSFCVEDWNFGNEKEDPRRRIYYSIFSMAMQYVIPFVTMTTIYAKIFCYLRTYRMVSLLTSGFGDCHQCH